MESCDVGLVHRHALRPSTSDGHRGCIVWGRLWAAIASDHEETLRGMAMTPPVEYGCSQDSNCVSSATRR